MRKSGYCKELEYSKPPKKKRNRKRNVVWFNPPFSESVKNNIGRQFPCLIDKHFPKHHRLHKICNSNTVEISCSCMPNMASIISSHNKKFFNGGANTPSKIPACNCRNKTSSALSTVDAASKPLFTKLPSTLAPALHTILGAAEPSSKPGTTATVIRSRTVKEATRQNSLKPYGRPRIRTSILLSSGQSSIEHLLTNPGPEIAASVYLKSLQSSMPTLLLHLIADQKSQQNAGTRTNTS